jgi:hypothetical protein
MRLPQGVPPQLPPVPAQPLSSARPVPASVRGAIEAASYEVPQRPRTNAELAGQTGR